MSEVKNVEKKKRKFSLIDNIVVIVLVAFASFFAGQLLGLMVLRNLLISVLEMLIPGVTTAAIGITAISYLNFLGIWLVSLLVLATTPRNRPILKCLTAKVRGNTGKLFAVGLGFGLGTNLLCALIAMLHGDIRIAFVSFQPVSLLIVFVTVLIQCGAEELIFRLWIHHRLMRRYGSSVFAVLVTNLLFALAHGGNPGAGFVPFLSLFALGLLCSALVIYLDSPWAAVAAHTAWNFCQNILLGLPNSGSVASYSVFKLETAADSFAYNVGFGLEGAITAAVILLAAAGLTAWWGTKRKTVPTNIWDAEV
jgi:membrane protease YdiL (CAAX protease family)